MLLSDFGSMSYILLAEWKGVFGNMGFGSKEKKLSQEEKSTIITDMAKAQDELKAVKAEYGIEEEEKGIYKLISKYYARKERVEQTPIKKKTYILLLIFTGIFGGHRFYSKQYPTAILYLVTCWFGFSFVMSLIDLMIVAPLKADENGIITLGQKKYVYDND